MRRPVIALVGLLLIPLWLPSASATGCVPVDGGRYEPADGPPPGSSSAQGGHVRVNDSFGVYVMVDNACVNAVMFAVQCVLDRVPGAAMQEGGNVVTHLQLDPQMQEWLEGLGFEPGAGVRGVEYCL